MTDRGYKDMGNNIYEKGNGILRLLLGGFYQYYKIQIVLQYFDNGHVRVAINKRVSGFSGGIIGINQMKKELNAIKHIVMSL